MFEIFFLQNNMLIFLSQTCRVNSNLTFAGYDLSSLHEACIFLQSQSTDEFETCQRKLATVAPLRLLLTSLVL